MYRSKSTNVHHILATSKGGSNHMVNTTVKKKVTHAAYHAFFINDTIQEAVNRLLAFQGNALNADAKFQIQQAVSEDDIRYYYRKECFRN